MEGGPYCLLGLDENPLHASDENSISFIDLVIGSYHQMTTIDNALDELNNLTNDLIIMKQKYYEGDKENNTRTVNAAYKPAVFVLNKKMREFYANLPEDLAAWEKRYKEVLLNPELSPYITPTPDGSGNAHEIDLELIFSPTGDMKEGMDEWGELKSYIDELQKKYGKSEDNVEKFNKIKDKYDNKIREIQKNTGSDIGGHIQVQGT